jgi:hypothetical protein
MTLGLIPKLQRWIHEPNELVNEIRFQIDPQLKEGQNPEIKVVVDSLSNNMPIFDLLARTTKEHNTMC